MSRYVLLAILALVAFLTLRGVSSSWNVLEQLDRSRTAISADSAAAENEDGTQAVSNDTTDAGEGAASLGQAGQNVRRLASQNAQATGETPAQDNFGTAPASTASDNQQAAEAGATGATGTPATTNQDPIPALW